MSDSVVLIIMLMFNFACGYVVGRGQRGFTTAVFLLTLPRSQEDEAEVEKALEGLKNRGVITAEQAEAAKRRIAKEGGAA